MLHWPSYAWIEQVITFGMKHHVACPIKEDRGHCRLLSQMTLSRWLAIA